MNLVLCLVFAIICASRQIRAMVMMPEDDFLSGCDAVS